MAERPRRVLIVDDEAAVSDIVRRYLTAERYEVAVAVDGGEAMTRFGSFRARPGGVGYKVRGDPVMRWWRRLDVRLFASYAAVTAAGATVLLVTTPAVGSASRR
jgi:CheY-like chemotaxis protein